MNELRQRDGDQPLPAAGQQNVSDAVKADLDKRIALGIQRYGRPLQTFNGRDALQDAYEEALDLVHYLKQALLERDASQQTERRERARAVEHMAAYARQSELERAEASHDEFCNRLANLLGDWCRDGDAAIDSLLIDAIESITAEHPHPPCYDPESCEPGQRCTTCRWRDVPVPVASTCFPIESPGGVVARVHGDPNMPAETREALGHLADAVAAMTPGEIDAAAERSRRRRRETAAGTSPGYGQSAEEIADVLRATGNG